MDLCFTCVSLQSYSPTSSKPGNWIFVVEFIPLGSCSCHTTTAILIAPLRLTFSVSDLSRAVPYLSLCFSVRFTSPAQISYLVAYHSYVSTGHQVIITFHVSNDLACLPHPLSGDRHPRKYLIILILLPIYLHQPLIPGRADFTSNFFIIVGKNNFHVTWFGTRRVYHLCCYLTILLLSDSDHIFIHLRLSALKSWKLLVTHALCLSPSTIFLLGSLLP